VQVSNSSDRARIPHAGFISPISDGSRMYLQPSSSTLRGRDLITRTLFFLGHANHRYQSGQEQKKREVQIRSQPHAIGFGDPLASGVSICHGNSLIRTAATMEMSLITAALPSRLKHYGVNLPRARSWVPDGDGLLRICWTTPRLLQNVAGGVNMGLLIYSSARNIYRFEDRAVPRVRLYMEGFPITSWGFSKLFILMCFIQLKKGKYFCYGTLLTSASICQLSEDL
jgi:hypothetical protein